MTVWFKNVAFGDEQKEKKKERMRESKKTTRKIVIPRTSPAQERKCYSFLLRDRG